MKRIIIKKLVASLPTILLTAAAPMALAAPPQTGVHEGDTRVKEHQGHHQSGIVGSVNGGVIIATPTGEGSEVRPNLVRVYTADFPHELVAQVETEVQGLQLWHFEVYLKPGDYLVVASAVVGPFFSYPVPVTVEKHEFTEVPALVFAPQ